MHSLYDLSPSELEAHVVACGFPKYRARQIWRWAYRHAAASYDEMKNVPAVLRERLSDDLPIPRFETLRSLESEDGLTRKRLIRLADGTSIESVLMLYDPRGDSRGRATVCVSSQAGCAVGCVFCATGQAGFDRNLSAGEIIAQVVSFAREQADRGSRALTNVVFMGMGEPMANYRAVWRAIETLTEPDGLNFAARHITISTVGHVPGIRRLAEERLQVGLAVSLHAPDDELRQRLIPTAHRFPLGEIISACGDYVAKTRRRVTFEYCLMDGINDAPEQARSLAALLAGTLCHVNLIPVNPTSDGMYGRPPRSRTLAFQHELESLGIACTVRVEKGVEISAACGQLRADTPAKAQIPVVP